METIVPAPLGIEPNMIIRWNPANDAEYHPIDVDIQKL